MTRKESLQRARKLIFSNKLSAFGAITVGVFLCLALLFFVTRGGISPYNPSAINLNPSSQNLLPSAAHLFGTDNLGRDIFSRVLAALPIDLSLPIAIVFLSAVIGILFGTIAGYLGGFVEEVIMRLTDMFLAFPTLIMALAVAATLGPSLLNVTLSLVFVWWPPYVRLVRGGVLAVKSEDYMAVSRSLNSSFPYILRKGLLPNILPSVLVYASLDIGTALLSVSSLGFLNVGIPTGTPELGAMVNLITQNILYTYPWEALIPAFIVLLIVLGFSLFGDGIREAGDVKVRPHMLIKSRVLGGLAPKEN